MVNLASGLQSLVERSTSVEGPDRAPFYFSSELRKAEGRGGVTMQVNPKTVRFTRQKRISRVDGVGRTTFHHFVNDRWEDNDLLILSFNGNTGNIDLRGSFFPPEEPPVALTSGTAVTAQRLVDQDTRAFKRLSVWQDLLALTTEPVYYRSQETKQRTRNIFRVTYESKVFPSPILFFGFFSKPLEFQDDAQKPHSLDYTMEFTVESSIPSLSNYRNNLFVFSAELRLTK